MFLTSGIQWMFSNSLGLYSVFFSVIYLDLSSALNVSKFLTNRFKMDIIRCIMHMTDYMTDRHMTDYMTDRLYDRQTYDRLYDRLYDRQTI
jgi:hypothetical protein